MLLFFFHIFLQVHVNVLFLCLKREKELVVLVLPHYSVSRPITALAFVYIGLTWGHFSDGDNEVLFIVQ